jgi:hypothetical protein
MGRKQESYRTAVRGKSSVRLYAVAGAAGTRVGGVITILPKVPVADDEYTPAQRRAIDAELDEAEKGPFHGPFDTADQMIAHLKRRLKSRAKTKNAKRSR